MANIDVSIETNDQPAPPPKHPNTCPSCHSHYRDDELDRVHPLRILLGELAGTPSVERLALPRLSPDAVALLAAPHGVDPAARREPRAVDRLERGAVDLPDVRVVLVELVELDLVVEQRRIHSVGAADIEDRLAISATHLVEEALEDGRAVVGDLVAQLPECAEVGARIALVVDGAEIGLGVVQLWVRVHERVLLLHPHHRRASPATLSTSRDDGAGAPGQPASQAGNLCSKWHAMSEQTAGRAPDGSLG